MKTKIFTLVLALVASVGTIFAQSGTTGTIQWTLSNGVLTVSPYEAPEGDIPDYNGGSFSPWYSYNDQIKKIVVADKIFKIGKRAFQGTYAESVVLGSRVTSIGELAFSYNTRLKAITIPASVSTIGKDAFDSCYELDSVAFLRTQNVPTCGEKPFSLTNDNLIIYVPYSLIKKYRSAENLSVYGDKIKPHNPGTCGTNLVWQVSSGILNISGTGEMDDYSVDEAPWTYGWNPTRVYIGEGVTYIGKWSFDICKNLTLVNISNTVTSIGQNAFDNPDLMTITCFAPNPPECGDGVFTAVDKTKAKLYVLPNAIAAYKAADQWKDFGDNILPIGGPTAIQQVANQESQVINQKFIKDGQLLILRNGKTYTVQGQEVK